MASVVWRQPAGKKPKDFTGQSSVNNPSGPRSSGQELSAIDFKCPECGQGVKGNRGYYVEHEITFTNRYGLAETRLCSASNNKIKADLRTLVLHGQCDHCDTEFDFKLTEEYPGGLKQEGGVMEVPCIVCHGKTTATCEHCGGNLSKNDEGVWIHDMTDKNECPFSGSIVEDQLDDDLDDEFFEAAPQGPKEASPLAGTEKTAELHMVLVSDNYEIPEYVEETEQPEVFDEQAVRPGQWGFDESNEVELHTNTTSEDVLAQDQEV